MPRWVNTVMAVAGVVMLAGLATVVAIPMVAQHRLDVQFEATRIVIPETFNGEARQPVEQAAAALSSPGPGFTKTELGLYGSNLNLVLIVAARPAKALDDNDQAHARAEFQRNFAKTSDGAQPTLTQVANPGPLGGWFGCGPVSGVTLCVATDPGALVAVVMGPGTADPRELARQARQAAVTRSQ
jgi:hypothetical protein